MSLLKIMRLQLFALLALLVLPAAAFAVEAAATVDLNVRSGPSTSYGVVDTLNAGEVVTVGECASNSWCYIYQDGPNGWVSSNYLTPTSGSSGGSSDPDCSLSLTIGAGGTPSLTLTCGSGSTPAPTPTPTPTPTPVPAPVGDQACFYTNNNYGGSEFCYGTGTLNSLNATFNDRISSVRVFGAAKAKLCRNSNLGGVCRLVGSDVPVLGGAINDKASSVLVFTGAAPTPAPVAPVTYSTGLLNLQQTYSADLDTGNIGGSGADIWYEAVTAVEKYITPQSGAKLSLGDGSNRGLAGCSTASYSGGRLSIWVLPVGTYVCVKTAQGRISQFRLNGYTGTTMKLGYTTWAN
ncbi:MAG: SH3 domain-containing protein [Alphaproteobacteria bacterium]|nr:SH3 domain-containing protein [Alphaproteobacteria bacterium]